MRIKNDIFICNAYIFLIGVCMFFTLKDDFQEIIGNILGQKKLSVEKISTGWTNYVFFAKAGKKKYIFRFPRNDFFAETLIKEESFCKLIKNKISYKIPDIKLFYDKERPFTMHKYINGKTLTECCNSLTEKQKKQLGKDIARFIYEIQKIKVDNLKLPLLSDFLEGLSKVGDENYDLSNHDVLKKLEKNAILSHADFNPGNIVLNKKNRMFAVLDFAFVSYTSDIVDISRMIGRLPEDFHNCLIEEYNKYLKTNVNVKSIYEIIDVWKYVEEKYIIYMKKNHPDVCLPNI